VLLGVGLGLALPLGLGDWLALGELAPLAASDP